MEINKVYQGDCMDLLKVIPDTSVDLIIADPPYYKVMVFDHLRNKYDWDNQWKSFKEYIDWCKIWLKEVYRILKSNGSFYLFADDKNVSYLHIETERINFFLENHIVWVKPNNMPIKGWANFRCYAPVTERILFFSKEPRNTNLENPSYFENVKIFSPIVEYMIEQKKKIKELLGFKTDKEFNDYINKKTETASVVSRHYFTYSQWVFPTKEIWEKLQSVNEDIKANEVFRKDYEVFRRTFNPKRNYTDVWTYNITSSQEKCVHPTQKPIALIRRIIDTSSKENDLVVDLFIGSGTIPLACQQMNRRWVGSENNPEYIPLINKRLNQQSLHHFYDTQNSTSSGFATQNSLNSDLTETSKVSQIPQLNKEELR